MIVKLRVMTRSFILDTKVIVITFSCENTFKSV
ncbi:hypothetical protein JOD28_001265 [Leuconostoc rapi]|nr:hypothetical protein [Leuconostoc rapi]